MPNPRNTHVWNLDNEKEAKAFLAGLKHGAGLLAEPGSDEYRFGLEHDPCPENPARWAVWFEWLPLETLASIKERSKQ